jgi:hypothetical protein
MDDVNRGVEINEFTKLFEYTRNVGLNSENTHSIGGIHKSVPILFALYTFIQTNSYE